MIMSMKTCANMYNAHIARLSPHLYPRPMRSQPVLEGLFPHPFAKLASASVLGKSYYLKWASALVLRKSYCLK